MRAHKSYTKSDLQYEDVDETGEPIAQDKRPSWMIVKAIPQINLCKAAMLICGNRRYFGKRGERSKWRTIGNSLDHGRISLEWVENCIAWAQLKNEERPVITFEALENLILNSSRMKDWEAKQEAPVIMESMKDVIEWDHE